MRGKVVLNSATPRVDGITPAYAGKRRKSCSTSALNEDHPRLCGEKSRTGTRKMSDRRITPAYAGKSLHVVGLFVNVQDHPRLCGEKSPAIVLQSTSSGITPAYAGKSHSPDRFL